MQMYSLCPTVALSLFVAVGGMVQTARAVVTPPPGPVSYNHVVQSTLQPAAEELLKKLVKEGRKLTLQGVPVFDGTDKFLPGKIAVGLTDFLLALPKDDPRLPGYLQSFRRIAALTADDTNDSWGIYYYLIALNGLRKAGLLQDSVDRLTLAKLRVKLNWRMFVDDSYTLIDHPNNYYCVALGIALLRTQMGWEDGSDAQKLFAKIKDQYRRYSGDFGFSDETDGEGRFDRYSVLLAGEIAHHFLETGNTVPPEALTWLRKLRQTSPSAQPNLASPKGHHPSDVARFQNSRSRLIRSFGGLPAIMAALIAPIDMPAIQSGSMPRSASAS